MLVMLRLVIAAMVLLGVLYARGLRLPARWRTWADFLFLGVIGLIFPYLLITWSEQTIPRIKNPRGDPLVSTLFPTEARYFRQCFRLPKRPCARFVRWIPEFLA